MQSLAIAVAAYLLGSLSFAVLVSKAMGLPDPRGYGSGNPGATNVLRSGSRLAAVLTLAGDAGKGALAVVLAALYTGEPAVTGFDAPMAGAMALLGHLYPLYHRFKGGKGVATAVGVLLAIDWKLGLGALATFGIIIAFFRIVSLSSIISALFAVFWSFFLFEGKPVSFAVMAIALLVIWRHRDNMLRIARGAEPRIGGKKI